MTISDPENGPTLLPPIAHTYGGVSRRYLARWAADLFSRERDTADTPHAAWTAAPRNGAELIASLASADDNRGRGLGRRNYYVGRCACRLRHRRARATPAVAVVHVAEAPALRTPLCFILPVGSNVPVLSGVLPVRVVVPLPSLQPRSRQCWGAALCNDVADGFHIRAVDNFVVYIRAFVAGAGVDVMALNDFTGAQVTAGDVGVRMVVSDDDQLDGWTRGAGTTSTSGLSAVRDDGCSPSVVASLALSLPIVPSGVTPSSSPTDRILATPSRSGPPSASAASVDESAGDASVYEGADRVEKVTSKLIWGIGGGVGVGGVGADAAADEDAPLVSESARTSATCSSSVKKKPSA